MSSTTKGLKKWKPKPPAAVSGYRERIGGWTGHYYRDPYPQGFKPWWKWNVWKAPSTVLGLGEARTLRAARAAARAIVEATETSAEQNYKSPR